MLDGRHSLELFCRDRAYNARQRSVAPDHSNNNLEISTMQLRSLLVAGAALLAACSDSSTSPMGIPTGSSLSQSSQATGGVFVSTNDLNGNAVVGFARAADGSLSWTGTYATGGKGIGGVGDPLASQFAVALSPNAKILVVANAGSNDVSSFAVSGGSLSLVDRASSSGTRPVSIAISKDYVYALNTISSTIGVLAIGSDGSLTALPSKTKALPSGANGAAEVRISPNGQLLVVTERVSNRLETFAIGKDGSLGDGVVTPAAGTTPFGFDFTTRGQVIVSEAASGSASSYNVNADGTLAVATAAATTTQKAPCWLIVNNSGRFAYTANAGSATITGFAIAASGTLSLLTSTGVSGDLGTGAMPLDLDMSRNGSFLYVMKNGTGTIGAFSVAGDGSLAPLADTPGLVARAGYMGLAAY
jgi:6-phosphogluconolactonase